jgi:hypothetical protein
MKQSRSAVTSVVFIIQSEIMSIGKIPHLPVCWPKNLSENAQASLRAIRWIMAILIQASLVRGLIS